MTVIHLARTLGGTACGARDEGGVPPSMAGDVTCLPCKRTGWYARAVRRSPSWDDPVLPLPEDDWDGIPPLRIEGGYL